MFASPFRARSVFAWLMLLLPFLIGCSSAGDLSGTVSYRNKPVVTGTVTVVVPGQSPLQGAIDEQGNYRVTGVPAGDVKLLVSSPNPNGGPVKDPKLKDKIAKAEKGNSQPKVANWQEIPAKYGVLADPLINTTVNGNTVFNIVLE